MKKELNKKQREFCCAGKGNKKSANRNAKTVLQGAAATVLYGTHAANRTKKSLDVAIEHLNGPEEIQAWNE